jgi:hypothetical protein
MEDNIPARQASLVNVRMMKLIIHHVSLASKRQTDARWSGAKFDVIFFFFLPAQVRLDPGGIRQSLHRLQCLPLCSRHFQRLKAQENTCLKLKARSIREKTAGGVETLNAFVPEEATWQILPTRSTEYVRVNEMSKTAQLNGDLENTR